MRCRSAGPWTSAILSPMPEILPWHVRGQGLIAGQAPARRIRALHMEFATGDCIPLLPQQTAYILQVILAQFGRLAARSCTFRTRSILSLRGLLIPSSGRRRRWYYGQTAPLMVWYPRAPPSPTLADPMLPIGSDGEHRLWRHGTRLEAVRDHKWHGYYGNGARRNRTRLRPVTYYDGKSDFRRRKHLGIWRVLGSVCLLQTGLRVPRKKIQKKLPEAASKVSQTQPTDPTTIRLEVCSSPKRGNALRRSDVCRKLLRCLALCIALTSVNERTVRLRAPHPVCSVSIRSSAAIQALVRQRRSVTYGEILGTRA